MRSRGTPSWTSAFLAPAIVVTGLLFAACGDEGDHAERLAAELVEETGGALDEAQATCVADGLDDSFGDESFRAVLDAAEGSGEDADDVRIEVIDIFAACDALDAVVLDSEPDEAEEPGGG